MMTDFIYLNVPGLLSRYENPTEEWVEKVYSLAQTQISFFVENGLISPSAAVLTSPIETAVLMFSDFSPEGQAFLKSQAVERWLSACDKKGTIDAYRDSSGLTSRLAKFRKR
ncbi:hypothetical protein [Caulobacter mirabilis]|uniref:hypothetical protein n=1 Tax=Caulobacter mirabilis TaxID=69666 RepID=UPI0012374A97|nr:hypothetical protein [Caulobacter mirabilis]